MKLGKECKTCVTWKLWMQFSKNKSNPDGYASQCKSCVREYQRTIVDRRAEYNQQYREANRETFVLKRAENRERTAQRAKRWYEANREQIKQKGREWEQNNPDKRKAIIHRRRAGLESSDRHYTAEEWQALCAKYDYRCLCCGEQKPLTVDHIVPISRNGSNDIDNIQPLCRSCNSKKHDSIIDYRPATTQGD